MTIGNATVLEIVWTLTGIVGFLICAWALNDALADLRWQEAAIPPQLPDRRSRDSNRDLAERMVRERIARGNARDESLRCLIQLIVVGIGIVAMATAPANPERAVTPLSFVIAAGFIAIQIILVVKAVMGRRDRAWNIGTLTYRDWQTALDDERG